MTREKRLELMAKLLDDFKAHTLTAVEDDMDVRIADLGGFLRASLDVFEDTFSEISEDYSELDKFYNESYEE